MSVIPNFSNFSIAPGSLYQQHGANNAKNTTKENLDNENKTITSKEFVKNYPPENLSKIDNQSVTVDKNKYTKAYQKIQSFDTNNDKLFGVDLTV